MLIKLLGIADILTILALIGSTFLPQQIIIIMGIYLIIKGLFFIVTGSLFPNFFDMISGVYIIIVSFGFSHWIPTSIVILFLVQKAFISLI